MYWITMNLWILLVIIFIGSPVFIILIKIVMKSFERISENKKLRGVDIEAVKKTAEEIEKSIQIKKKKQEELQGAYDEYKDLGEFFQEKIKEADIKTVAKMVKKLEESRLQGAYKEYKDLKYEISKLQKKLEPALEMLKPRERIINSSTINPCIS